MCHLKLAFYLSAPSDDACLTIIFAFCASSESLIEIPDKSALLLVGNFARRQTTEEQPADDDDTCLEDVKIKAEMSAICFSLRFAREMDEGPVKGFAKIFDNLHGKKFS